MNTACLSTLFLTSSVLAFSKTTSGQTEITRWQDGKPGAISLTYDDGSINQFRYALPIMKRLQLPATFYIITGPIPGSKYQGRFIGRQVREIIEESKTVPTDSSNYFERESAAKYLGFIGADAYYDTSANFFEDGKEQDAYRVIDTLYSKVRNGQLQKGVELTMEVAGEKGLTWDSIKKYAAEGYEFASHTVTHAHMAVLDTTNMFYELQKSKADIRDHLGDKYTFTAEIPFGIEHPRAMKYALPVYAALRNLMTDPYMLEINRGYRTQPGSPGHEYVQWQRGPTTKTSPELMNAWVDTTLSHDNIWLVLVFHGVDGLGYEALSHELLDNYFQYIKKHENSLWVATFSDVAKYMRERMHASVDTKSRNNEILIELKHSLDPRTYNVGLTLKTYVPETWRKVVMIQNGKSRAVTIFWDKKGRYVLYRVHPNEGSIRLVGSR